MKKYLILAIVAVSLSACAGVHGNVGSAKAPAWDGDIVGAQAGTKASWVGFQILPCLWGGLGFNLNGDAIRANVLPLNAEADFTPPATK